MLYTEIKRQLFGSAAFLRFVGEVKVFDRILEVVMTFSD